MTIKITGDQCKVHPCTKATYKDGLCVDHYRLAHAT